MNTTILVGPPRLHTHKPLSLNNVPVAVYWWPALQDKERSAVWLILDPSERTGVLKGLRTSCLNFKVEVDSARLKYAAQQQQSTSTPPESQEQESLEL